ncbi:hypothetical protein [Chlorogloeopsis fritschii]|uniref:hypothetical protein n=1 Tax=Chlorogloeopsis fritschii TaxID=1124 RepID=UPI000F8F1747|nr:hypothetical protein [Chlorogloeopsis fritschii]
MATSTPNSSPSTQTNFEQSSQVSNNLEAKLQQQAQALEQCVRALLAERDAAYNVINSLLPFVRINEILNGDIAEMDKTIAMLTPFVGIANIRMNDALAYEQVLNNVVKLMHDPEFLVYWANHVWQQSIMADGAGAIAWISDEYLKLLDTYEQRYVGVHGKHSPVWERLQPKQVNPVMGSPDSQNFVPPQFQQQVNPQVLPQQQFQQSAVPPQYQQQIPMPPIPGNTQGQDAIGQLRQRIEMLKAGIPDLGMQLQRAHAQQRQQNGIAVPFI